MSGVDGNDYERTDDLGSARAVRLLGRIGWFGLRDSEIFGNGVVSTRKLDGRTGEVNRIESFADASGLSVDGLVAGSHADRLLSRLELSFIGTKSITGITQKF